MKKNLLIAWAFTSLSVAILPVHAATYYWDNGATNGLWGDPVNWGNNNPLDPTLNILPGAGDTALFTVNSPPGNVAVTNDFTVNRIRLTSATVPRIIEIGTNEVVDRTLILAGNAAELLDQFSSGVGRDLTFSGAPNTGGFELKLQFNALKPINVASTNSSLFVSADISGVGGFDKTGAGKLVLSGSNTYSAATSVSGGTLLVNSPGSLPAVSTVTVNNSGTLGGSGTIHGDVIVNAGGTLSPGDGVGTLTLSSNLTLSGNLFIQFNKTLTPSNDVIAVTGNLTNAGTGTVTVMNIGPVGLAVGDSFTLFNKPLPNGDAMTIFSPVGVVWTNRLAVDGSIAALSVPPVSPATNLTIAVLGPSTIGLGGQGLASRPYDVYASTDVALPMASWTYLGTTNSDAGGVIQFVDSAATAGQKFYRFGQALP